MILANVRKKGRPKVYSAEQFAELKAILDQPDRSYRATYERVRAGVVLGTLIESCGEKPTAATHPKSAERYPWLLGKKIQLTVLAELYGLPDAAILGAAKEIEKLHRERPMNAKGGRKVARLFKTDLRRRKGAA